MSEDQATQQNEKYKKNIRKVKLYLTIFCCVWILLCAAAFIVMPLGMEYDSMVSFDRSLGALSPMHLVTFFFIGIVPPLFVRTIAAKLDKK